MAKIDAYGEIDERSDDEYKQSPGLGQINYEMKKDDGDFEGARRILEYLIKYREEQDPFYPYTDPDEKKKAELLANRQEQLFNLYVEHARFSKERSEFKEAVEYAKKAMDLDVGDGESLYVLADLLMNIGEFEMADNAFTKSQEVGFEPDGFKGFGLNFAIDVYRDMLKRET